MAYQRKPIGSPCSHCGEPVTDENVAVRTLNNYLPYVPKIWHRPCLEARKAQQQSAAPALATAGAR